MSLLNKLFGDKTPMPVVRDDSTRGHPGSRMIQMHARKKDWRKVRDAMAKETDHALRGRYLSLCTDEDASDEWIEQWLEAEPESADGWLMAGDRSLIRAWKIRGSDKADAVPKERWDPFHELVMTAEEELYKAAELNRNDPLALCGLLRTSMTLGGEIEERMDHFEEGVRRAPRYYGTYWSAVYALTQKWGGSHDLMFELARQSVKTAPEGTAIPAVLAMAHAERLLYYIHWENNEEILETYFKDKSLRQELEAAFRSIQGLPKSEEVWAANAFSFCFVRYDDKLAKEAFKMANGFCGGLPWDYMGEKAYKRHLERVWK